MKLDSTCARRDLWRRVAGAAILFAASSALHAASDESARIRRFETSLRPGLSIDGQPERRWTLAERMAHWKVPGVSVAVIRNGRIAWAKGYGVLQAGRPEKVDVGTVFSVGSTSKVATAGIALRLVDEGRLNLDRDVNAYLGRWRVPGNAHTQVRPVTLRGIMSHSAGLTVSGFADYQPDDALPTIVQTLDGTGPAKNPPVRVDYVPGSRSRYSGGGTTVEQLAIEDATGLDFEQAARRYLFAPLGMARSSFLNPLPPEHGNIAKAHDGDGKPRALPRGYEAMPEQAASGLWATPSDYARFVIALIDSYQGRPGSFLSAALARQMMTEVGRSTAGLGPFLEGEGLQRRFSHSGGNDSYRAWMEGHLGTGDGVVIYTNSPGGDELFEEIRRAVAVAEGWAPALGYHVRVPALKLGVEELEARVGLYEPLPPSTTWSHRYGGGAVVYRVFRRDGDLYLAADDDGDEDGIRLVPMDAARFITEDGRHRMEFVHDYDGRVASLVLRGAGEAGTDSSLEARKVPGDPAGR